MKNFTQAAPETLSTNDANELSDAALDGVSGGAWYIKFDGVDGESRKKGNVEYSWKVEEGQK